MDNKIILAEEFIGKKVEEFTVEDIEKIIKSEDSNISSILSDKAFLYNMLNVTKSDEIKALYYHIYVSDNMFNSIKLIGETLKTYGDSINLQSELTSDVIDNNRNNPATTKLLIDLNKLWNQQLSVTTQYLKLGAIIQLATLFNDIDIDNKKEEIKQCLSVIYKDLNNINAVFGLGVAVSILNSFVETIDNIWIHKYDESIVDTSNTDYSEAIARLNTVITELNKNKNSTPMVQ